MTTLPSIIYYGPSGIAVDVFQGYMASLGYRVRSICPTDDLLTAIKADPFAIVVLALDTTVQELLTLVRHIRSKTDWLVIPIFVLAASESFDPHMECVFVIPRPFRLSTLARKIQALTRPAAREPAFR